MFDKFFARFMSANQADIKTFVGYTFATLINTFDTFEIIFIFK